MLDDIHLETSACRQYEEAKREKHCVLLFKYVNLYTNIHYAYVRVWHIFHVSSDSASAQVSLGRHQPH